jgi:hypothetical protein
VDPVEGFESNREHLRGVAYRVLGSVSEAEDAVQEAWLRLQRTDASEVDNLRAWLTTVVNSSRSRSSGGPTIPSPARRWPTRWAWPCSSCWRR